MSSSFIPCKLFSASLHACRGALICARFEAITPCGFLVSRRGRPQQLKQEHTCEHLRQFARQRRHRTNRERRKPQRQNMRAETTFNRNGRNRKATCLHGVCGRLVARTQKATEQNNTIHVTSPKINRWTVGRERNTSSIEQSFCEQVTCSKLHVEQE